MAVRRGAPAMRSAPTRSAVVSSPAAALALLMAITAPALGAYGCQSPDPKEDLRRRATEYLQLKQKREWTAIYEGILDPEARKTVKLEDFLKPRKESIDMLGFQLVSTEVNQENGSVKVKVDVVIPVLSPRG